jgi:DNA helicase-2/ATP-dependent DNA helicase PcrA
MLLEKPPAGKMPDTGNGKTAARKKRTPRKAKDGELVSGEGLSICVTQMITDSGIAAFHLEHDPISGSQRLNNLQELVNAASLYDGTLAGLLEFLEHIELDRSLEDTSQTGAVADAENKVTLITFHNTKGMEYKKVIMTGLEQGVFPRENKKGEELEEERRLFYVGATRAMDELYFTSCALRRMFGSIMSLDPSPFLREIDKNCLRIVGTPPRSFGALRQPSKYDPTARERSDGWRRGQRLFHDDYGYGAVAEVRDSDDGPVVRVQFETGKELRFLSEHQGSAFEKMGNDD